jgi:hypothetical protein
MTLPVSQTTGHGHSVLQGALLPRSTCYTRACCTLIALALAAVGCRRAPTPQQQAGKAALAAASASAAARSSAQPANSAPAEAPPLPGVRARESERSRCGLLTAPQSPSLVSLFGKARPQLKRAELESLMNQGKAGAPQRVAVIVEGTGGVMCECPPLSFGLLEPDGSDFSPSMLTIAQKGVPSVDLNRTLLSFIVVGYFSGAWIDTYEYLHLQGDDNPVTDEETRSSYLELTAEFCLEASCYEPRQDLAPVAEKDADAESRKLQQESRNYWLERANEDLALVTRLGIPRCQRAWLRNH